MENMPHQLLFSTLQLPFKFNQLNLAERAPFLFMPKKQRRFMEVFIYRKTSWFFFYYLNVHDVWLMFQIVYFLSDAIFFRRLSSDVIVAFAKEADLFYETFMNVM